MNRHLRQTMLFGLVLILGAAAPVRTEKRIPEYLLKAQVIRVLADYVTWPDQEVTGTAFLAVVGYSPFEEYLETVFKTQDASGGSQSLCYSKKPALLCDSKILFICASESSVLPQILEKVKGKAVLTVSDTPGFAAKGVMINLSLKEKRPAFEINVKAVRDAKLRISAHVLKLAQIVDGPT